MKKYYFLSALVFMALNTYAQIEGTWRLAPVAGSLGVGPNQGDISWWSNSIGDVSVRACLFDDSIKFDSNGTMTHYMDGSTWVEGWQGSPDGCNSPVAPHDGATNAPYSYTYNSSTGNLIVNGTGAHMGLAKVYNGGELTSPANAPSSITYLTAFSNNNNTLTLDISIGGGWWRFVYQRIIPVSNPLEGTWRLAPAAGSLGVGPNQGDISWWSNSSGDVSVRACLFDDSIKFNANGTLIHYMDGSTWVEGWQGSPDGCNTPVAPHDGTTNAPYTYSYNSTSGELTLNGVGAHMGLAKVYNGGELTSPANAPSSITYLTAFSNNNNTLTLDISIGGGWWRFVYQRNATVTLPDPNVTFRVNMSNYTGTIATGVYVSGSFNNWCGDCNPLTNSGNGLWQTSLPIPAGNIEYKFTIDNWNVEETFTANDACIDPNTGDNFYNRYLQITGDVVLPSVCFNSCDPCPSNVTQLVGTWKLKPSAGSLAVGPSLGDGSWWSNGAADVTTRACLFDDSIKFEANGTMTHYLDGSTWLEAWQGTDPAACGTPVAPHNGVGPYSYTYSGGELTINGSGGHIGLAKVFNGGELTNPANAPTSIVYQLSFANNDNTMIADINFGPGWWRFIYEKTQQVVVADPNITFKVDMADYTGTISAGVFLNGTFNNWCGNCTPMTNTSGSIWEVTLPLTAGPIQYKFTVDGWLDQEFLDSGAVCLDPIADEFFNRYYVVSADASLPAVCFASCDVCPSSSLVEHSMKVNIMPNPANDFIQIESTSSISSIEVYSLTGNKVKTVHANGFNSEINVSELASGSYLLKVNSNDNYKVFNIVIE